MRAVLSRYRRVLAALMAAAAAAFGLAAMRPDSGGEKMVVATRDLAAGALLGPKDVTVRLFPARNVPDGVVSGPAGRTLSSPVRRGEPLTDARLRPPGPFSGNAALPGGRFPGDRLSGGVPSEGGSDGREADAVAAPVRLADAAVVRLLRAGDRVDVLAARSEGPLPARTVAAAVTVVAVPKSEEETDEGALIVVRTDRTQATALARAAVDSRLSVTILGS